MYMVKELTIEMFYDRAPYLSEEEKIFNCAIKLVKIV